METNQAPAHKPNRIEGGEANQAQSEANTESFSTLSSIESDRTGHTPAALHGTPLE
jgi:hypothetical protein